MKKINNILRFISSQNNYFNLLNIKRSYDSMIVLVKYPIFLLYKKLY